MIRFVIPLIAVVLFLLEPAFALFSPIQLGDKEFVLVPRFLILYLIFIAIYYNRKRAVIYGLIFGLLYDLVHINIIGVYVVLYPLVCFLAGSSVKFINQNLLINSIVSVLLVAMMETILYYFYLIIDFTSIPFTTFLETRLLSTIVSNFLFLLILGWLFKLIIDARIMERAREIS